MDANLLRAFLAITRSGSITGAADRLGIAQPSLSQQLLRLEDELGMKLFKRAARGVSQTDGGRVFEEHALNILRDIERAKEDMRALEGSVGGVVTVGLPMSVSLLIGVPLILEVKRLLPNVTLILEEAMSGHIREWLERNTVDLAVLYDAAKLRNLSVKTLVTEEVCLIGPPGDFGPVDDGGIALETVPLSAVEEIGLILPSRRHGLRQFVDNCFATARINPTVNIEVDSLSHIKALVSARHGRSILSRAAVSQELGRGELSAARLASTYFQRSIDLARNPSRMITRASVRVEDVMRDIINELTGNGQWVTAPDIKLEG